MSSVAPQFESLLDEGIVFYFVEESFNSVKPHYFVMLNGTPKNDENLIFVNATTISVKAIERRRNCPKETLVDVTPSQCSFLKVI